ncbi:hypothetical protein [Mastigocoleus sp. MO_188.B34]|uniref:hypothetical protein n=1 Tax=Mastigocoleus sp. MO_188.B34 TaxID=3036635 RepID=UPI00262AB3A1|nr:hypothetical protein [Mastigocoleus sp. MO_188.B34]MDJ0695079.1 hypothetical protein [Mastigocoleus sp. MO_188.B34]
MTGFQTMDSVKYEPSRVNMDVFDLAKLYKGSKSKATKMNDSLKAGLEEGEIAEVLGKLDVIESAATGIVGAGISFAIYKALKEFLHLEGARRRGELTNSEVIERVSDIAWKAGKQGVAVGAILTLVVMIFGSSILIPLSIISPFVGIQMAGSLWRSFWNGLDDSQKEELKNSANQLGGKIKNFFAELDKTEKDPFKSL